MIAYMDEHSLYNKSAHMKYLFNLVFFLVIFVSVSCGYNPVISIPKPKPYPSPSSQMAAGIAQADLTLPPGYPMAGYSINGRISRGYWIRPKATALYLRDEAGTPFVFVTTDLWAITDGQKVAVLKALSEDTATSFIGENDLLLAATHSHHSSGVIELDKAFASTSIGFGIDKAAFDFTIRQIVSAIKKAIKSVEVATITYAIDSIKGIAKNRSDIPYFANNETERQEYFEGQPEKSKFYRSKKEVESAIEKWISVVTVKNSEGKIKGVLASYPMHPTTTGDATEVYSADVFGIVSRQASDSISGNPIVAFYNGAEGDVAPDYRFHQRYDAVRIADSLSKAIIRLSTQSNQILLTGPITHHTEQFDIASAEGDLDSLDFDCYEIKPPSVIVHTSNKPVVGAAVLAGASDGRTSLSSFGISDGIRISKEKWEAKQGFKMPAVAFVTENVWGHVIPKMAAKAAKRYVKISPESKLHISMHKVGPVCFAGLPGEFTTMLGRRIRKAIADSAGIEYQHISLVGLADAYVSYVTTPCEYEQQYYEGASNFFGLSTGPAFVTKFKKLAKKDSDAMTDRKGRKTRFKAGKVVVFGPEFLGKLQVWNANEGLHNLMVSADGYRVYSREIPPFAEPQRIIDVDSNEVVVFSFLDQVNTINSVDFYPSISIQTADGAITPLPEHTLTVDKYAGSEPGTESVWSVRILNASTFADGIPRQLVVYPLSGKAPLRSGRFRLKGPRTR